MGYFVGLLLSFASFFGMGFRYFFFFDVHIITSCFSHYSFLFVLGIGFISF